MNSPRLDPAFIEAQRQKLIRLRAQLARSGRSGEMEESAINVSSQGEALESEDDAQRLALLEVEGTLVAHDADRLASIERALAKIEEGSYGRSDASGLPIPRERLEAMPEAIDTIEEARAAARR